MYVRFVGSDGDFIYFVAESSSRKGLEHDVSISKRDGIITCSCEDAQYRQKFGDLMDMKNKWKCKHVSRLCHTLGGILSTGADQGGARSPAKAVPLGKED